MAQANDSVLVVGAGITGIRASLSLAELGFQVILTEHAPYIGGILSKLDFQFPTDHCGMCKMLPLTEREQASQYCLRKNLFHDNLRVLPFTDIEDIEGEAGDFTVRLHQRARWVDTEVCLGGGLCVEACPLEVKDEFNEGLTRHKAIYQPVPHNLPNTFVIDTETCDLCGKCVEVCPVQAIHLGAPDREETLHVGAIVLAAGSDLYDPAEKDELYSYTQSPDIVTSLEFERLLSESGTYRGKILRPSDGQEAKRIAWVQCVGSRCRKEGRDYCSSICCMFSLKEAVLATERGGPEMETAIFYRDMRTWGKDFYQYRVFAEEERWVRLVRAGVHSVDVEPDGRLRIFYFDEEERQEERFDLVVLATGQNPPRVQKHLAQLLDIPLDDSGYLVQEGTAPIQTPRRGVFLCGSSLGLQDITESVTQATAAAHQVARLLQSERGSTSHTREEKSAPGNGSASRSAPGKSRSAPGNGSASSPSQGATPSFSAPASQGATLSSVTRGAVVPRVDLVLCHCGDVQHPEVERLTAEIRQRFASQESVASLIEVTDLCRGEGREAAAQKIQEERRGDRLLLGVCLPQIYQKMMLDFGQELGYDPALISMVDIFGSFRPFVQDGDSGNGVSRASRLDTLAMAVERLRLQRPSPLRSFPVKARALVVGGGLAGMHAALGIAEQGYAVTLVERTPFLGGNAAHKLYTTLDGLDPRALAHDLVHRVGEHPNITVHTETVVVESSGCLGAFRSRLQRQDGLESTVEHGVTIVATGAGEAQISSYHYGDSPQILTQSEMEEHLALERISPEKLQTVVMIQCVESRDEQHPYCSRVCCGSALKNTLQILRRNPQARVFVLYRDLMVHGFQEKFYTEARGKGAIFVPYTLEQKPAVTLQEGQPHLSFYDPVMQRPVEIAPDWLVLSAGVRPEASAEVARSFGLPLSREGFLQEADAKWRPVDFQRGGVFLCGLAHSPRAIPDALLQAEAAAQRATEFLSHEQLRASRSIAQLDPELCSGCGLCVEACAFDARRLNPLSRTAEVLEVLCQGCGACSTACPNGATTQRGEEQNQIMAALRAIDFVGVRP